MIDFGLVVYLVCLIDHDDREKANQRHNLSLSLNNFHSIERTNTSDQRALLLQSETSIATRSCSMKKFFISGLDYLINERSSLSSISITEKLFSHCKDLIDNKL